LTGTVGHVQGLTHSDTLNSDIDRRQWHSLTMEMKVGNVIAVAPSWLGHYEHQTAYPTAEEKCAMRTSPAPTYIMHPHNLRASGRQRCTCVFLVQYLTVN